MGMRWNNAVLGRPLSLFHTYQGVSPPPQLLPQPSFQALSDLYTSLGWALMSLWGVGYRGGGFLGELGTGLPQTPSILSS